MDCWSPSGSLLCRGKVQHGSQSSRNASASRRHLRARPTRGARTPRPRSRRYRATGTAAAETPAPAGRGRVPTSTTSDAVGRQVVAASARMRRTIVEPVGAAVMGDPRLGRIFGREGRQRLGADVGRIGEDEIVALAGVGGEQIGAQQRDALLQAVVAHIALGDGKRVLGDVAGIDRRIRETPGPPGWPGNPTRCRDRELRSRIADRVPAATRRQAPPSACTAIRRYRSAAR